MSICDKLVIHPDYWNHGLGSTLVNWGKELNNTDGIKQGVMPSHAGEKLFFALGYEEEAILQIPDDGEAEGFHISVAVYNPLSARPTVHDASEYIAKEQITNGR